VVFEQPGVAMFDPLDAGRLRAALREATDLYGRLSTCAPSPRRHPGPAPTPHMAVEDLEPTSTGRVQFQLSPEQDVPRGRHARREVPPESAESADVQALGEAA
jgi:hypothetical protein